MTRHYAYGLDLSDLDIAIVDDSKPMQAILRSTLLSFRVRRVRTYDTAETALEMMRLDPPNMIITDWRMKPMSGIGLLRAVRERRNAPLCFLPVIFVTAHGTRTLIDRILREGAQHVLAKPISPSALYDRILWTLRDARPLVMNEDGRYVIQGVAQSLDAKAQKWHQIGVGRTLIKMSQPLADGNKVKPVDPAAVVHPATGAGTAPQPGAHPMTGHGPSGHAHAGVVHTGAGHPKAGHPLAAHSQASHSQAKGHGKMPAGKAGDDHHKDRMPGGGTGFAHVART